MKLESDISPSSLRMEPKDSIVESEANSDQPLACRVIKVESNIEGQKNILNSPAACSLQSDECVKAEDHENEQRELSTDASDYEESNKHDPNSYCGKCKKSFNSRPSYTYHLKAIHGIKSVRRSILNPHILPDRDDPNFYCRACERMFNSRPSYTYHLKVVHGIMPFRTRLIPNPYIQPDKDDPNFYCKACKKTHNSRTSYVYHLKATHGIEPIVRRRSVKNSHTNEDNASFKCRSCDKTFNSKSIYTYHLKAFHPQHVESSSLVRISSLQHHKSPHHRYGLRFSRDS